ncbi:NADH dehydrogenase [Bradyrhizobium sp. CCBAU 11434]|nr:NADH dehydrogenase [Bradyrhizobium sp. CCBAU 11434]
MRVMRRFWDLANSRVRGLLALPRQIEDGKLLAAKTLSLQLASQGTIDDIRGSEFKVFSQFGEDGIIQYLIRQARIPAHCRSFIEFGVESYDEANTRFLLVNNNWRGLIIDGDLSNVRRVRSSSIYWRHNLVAVDAFVDVDNINGIFSENGFVGEIGLLSVDIDGNDYWVWDKIEVVNPMIVVAEYNSVFGPRHAVTVPYNKTFVRSRAHSSNLYWGASLGALVQLGERKGYAFVGSNSAGNNAFFVRRDCLNGQRVLTAAEGYVESQFRESRDEAGRLTFLSGAARLREIGNMLVYDVEHDSLVKLGDLN